MWEGKVGIKDCALLLLVTAAQERGEAYFSKVNLLRIC